MKICLEGASPIAVDHDGYLCHLSDWDERVAQHLAEQEVICLTEVHWVVVQVLRQFYQDYQRSPAMRVFIKLLQVALPEHTVNTLFLMQHFSATPLQTIAKIAGLPKPSRCID